MLNVESLHSFIYFFISNHPNMLWLSKFNLQIDERRIVLCRYLFYVDMILVQSNGQLNINIYFLKVIHIVLPFFKFWICDHKKERCGGKFATLQSVFTGLYLDENTIYNIMWNMRFVCYGALCFDHFNLHVYPMYEVCSLHIRIASILTRYCLSTGCCRGTLNNLHMIWRSVVLKIWSKEVKSLISRT